MSRLWIAVWSPNEAFNLEWEHLRAITEYLNDHQPNCRHQKYSSELTGFVRQMGIELPIGIPR